MVIPRKQAVVAGVIAIACILALQAFNSSMRPATSP